MIIIQYKKFNIIIMCTVKRKNVHINQSQYFVLYIINQQIFLSIS